VLVSAGARVKADEPLCVVVAMKMEVVVKAPVAGECLCLSGAIFGSSINLLASAWRVLTLSSLPSSQA